MSDELIEIIFRSIMAIGTSVVGVIIVSSLINGLGVDSETAILIVLLFNISLWGSRDRS